MLMSSGSAGPQLPSMSSQKASQYLMSCAVGSFGFLGITSSRERSGGPHNSLDGPLAPFAKKARERNAQGNIGTPAGGVGKLIGVHVTAVRTARTRHFDVVIRHRSITDGVDPAFESCFPFHRQRFGWAVSVIRRRPADRRCPSPFCAWFLLLFPRHALARRGRDT